jgi:hypothetical protein
VADASLDALIFRRKFYDKEEKQITQLFGIKRDRWPENVRNNLFDDVLAVFTRAILDLS